MSSGAMMDEKGEVLANHGISLSLKLGLISSISPLLDCFDQSEAKREGVFKEMINQLID